MRHIDLIVIHCSATKEGVDFHVEDLRQWHLDKGWSDVGYHYVVALDGTIEGGRPLERPGAHARGFNANSVGICYIGGLDRTGKPKDTRTPEQREALREIVALERAKHPEAEVVGHRDLGAPKACPCFSVEDDL